MKPKLLIILASTRPGRVGLPFATWFTELAIADGRYEVELHANDVMEQAAAAMLSELETLNGALAPLRSQV